MLNTILLVLITVLLLFLVIDSFLNKGNKAANKYLNKELPNGEKVEPLLWPLIGIAALMLFAYLGDLLFGVVLFFFSVFAGPYINYSVAWAIYNSKKEKEEIEKENSNDREDTVSNEEIAVVSTQETKKSFILAGAVFLIIIFFALAKR